MVIEVTTFRLLPAVAEPDFLVTDKRFQTEFAYLQPGLLRRTTGRDRDGNWVVIDVWTTAADADRCRQERLRQPSAQAWMALVDDLTVQSRRFEAVA